MTMILRLYGGLFTDFTSISEQQIARRCDMSETQVCNTLHELSRTNIVCYQPKTLKPQIVFCCPRIDIKDLHISDQNYRQLRETEKHRREAIIAYATNRELCRSQWLLRYFGEYSVEDTTPHQCGLCDICIERLKDSRSLKPEEEILKALATGPKSIKQLVEQIRGIEKEELIESVRKLLDRGKLKMGDGLIETSDR